MISALPLRPPTLVALALALLAAPARAQSADPWADALVAAARRFRQARLGR